MSGRNIAIGFGIAILLPALIFYGVSTLSPAPKYADDITADTYRHKANATAEERQADDDKTQAARKAYDAARSRFGGRLFYTAVPIGLAAILTGGLAGVSAVGTGLIFGGIFSVVVGFCGYWEFIADWQRFVSLLAAGAALLFIGLRKTTKSQPSS
ncbi:MAG TPA: hypothetical protein VME69_01440 [Methylocella sp.]|nr:hypothetical protein [Methylocella sp.]